MHLESSQPYYLQAAYEIISLAGRYFEIKEKAIAQSIFRAALAKRFLECRGECAQQLPTPALIPSYTPTLSNYFQYSTSHNL